MPGMAVSLVGGGQQRRLGVACVCSGLRKTGQRSPGPGPSSLLPGTAGCSGPPQLPSKVKSERRAFPIFSKVPPGPCWCWGCQALAPRGTCWGQPPPPMGTPPPLCNKYDGQTQACAQGGVTRGPQPPPQPKSEQGLLLTGWATIWFIMAEPGRGRPRKVRPVSRGLLLGVGDPHGWFSGDGAKVREAAASLRPWCRSGCYQAGVEGGCHGAWATGRQTAPWGKGSSLFRVCLLPPRLISSHS